MAESKCQWVYLQSESGLWTVGFYDPKDQWHAESDYTTCDAAAARVHYLNGGIQAGSFDNKNRVN